MVSRFGLVAWLVLRIAGAPGPLLLRVFASHSSGLGHLFSMHLVRLCPSLNGRVPVSLFWLSLICPSMLVGVVFLAFSSFLRCDLRGLPNASMLIVTVSSLTAGVSLVVWSFGHQSSFSSSCSHCVSSSAVVSWLAELVEVVQTICRDACRRRRRACLLDSARSVVLSCFVCRGFAVEDWVVSCFAVVPGWGWLAVSAVVFLLPVGIGTFGS